MIIFYLKHLQHALSVGHCEYALEKISIFLNITLSDSKNR